MQHLRIVLLGVALAGWLNGVMAQDAGKRAIASKDEVARVAQDPSIAEALEDLKQLMTQDIVVTAQKRSERVHDVPISISVLTGEELDRSTVAGTAEALDRVPGVSALPSIQGGNILLSVRGVTAANANFNGSSPVAYYLDTVPFGFVKSAFAIDSSAYDLERIEVLRGPQGTYYGASAQNGVVRVLTHGADLNRFEWKARASASSTDGGGNNSRIDSALNMPLIPGKLAARVVAGYQDLSGWIDKPNDNDANSAQLRNLRLRVSAQPSEDLSVDFSSWFSRGDHDAAAQSPDGLTSPSLLQEPIENDFEIYGLKMSYDFGSVTLTSATGYLDYFNENYADFALLGLPNTRLQTIFQSKSFSQEVLLQSASEGPWRWSIGAMYRDSKDRLYQNRIQYAQPTDYVDTSESKAVFTEVTRAFADGRFELTGGLRYFEDEVMNQEKSRGAVAVVPVGQLVQQTASFDKLSPRAILTWRPERDMRLYASYSEGFRSGFPQNGNVLFTAPQFAPLEADNLKNYELGSKSILWNGRMSLEAAVFYIDWQDIQQTLAINAGTLASPINVSALVNGESASGLGAELALNAKILSGLSIGVNFSWNDLNMDDDVRTFPAGGPTAGVVLFNRGDRLNFSPQYTAGAFAEYAFPLGWRGYAGKIWAGANYISELEARGMVGVNPSTVSGDTMLIGRTGFSFGPQRWTASVFIDNVNNENDSPMRQPNLPRAFDISIRPRTFGAQLEYRM